jgi:hypothetical protein
MPDRRAKCQPLLERVLKGETVEAGIFQAWEDFQYTRTKNDDGSPQFKRVICLCYFDEDDGDPATDPSTEDFDGTLDSFIAAIEAHDGFEMDDDEEEDDDETQDE